MNQVKIRRTKKQLKRRVPVSKKPVLYLDNEALQQDIVGKLDRLKKPQAYFTERLGLSRSTFWRISQKKEITLSTFFKLVQWLDKDLDTYVKEISPEQAKFRGMSERQALAMEDRHAAMTMYAQEIGFKNMVEAIAKHTSRQFTKDFEAWLEED